LGAKPGIEPGYPTADTALQLAKLFGTTAASWMGLQAQFDLEQAEERVRTATLRIGRPGFRRWRDRRERSALALGLELLTAALMRIGATALLGLPGTLIRSGPAPPAKHDVLL
jgi:hypothetical protein